MQARGNEGNGWTSFFESPTLESTYSSPANVEVVKWALHSLLVGFTFPSFHRVNPSAVFLSSHLDPPSPLHFRYHDHFTLFYSDSIDCASVDGSIHVKSFEKCWRGGLKEWRTRKPNVNKLEKGRWEALRSGCSRRRKL